MTSADDTTALPEETGDVFAEMEAPAAEVAETEVPAAEQTTTEPVGALNIVLVSEVFVHDRNPA